MLHICLRKQFKMQYRVDNFIVKVLVLCEIQIIFAVG